MTISVKDNITKIKAECAIEGEDVNLIAVSKTHGPDKILQAIKANITDFGENKLQEAQNKWPEIKKTHPHVKLHMIGHLQSNKAKDALELFDVIQTLGSEKLARKLANLDHNNKEFYIQVNTGEEEQKHGIIPAHADEFIELCKTLGLNVTGLMCIPPANLNPNPHFALLKKMAEKHSLPNLSMGMSSDYLSAIKLGATHIRVGTGIFGARHS